MGNCAASRLAAGGFGGDHAENPVSLCRERKRLIKAAVDHRYALAAAHGRYLDSLQAVAAAIDLFVARHSSPAPILITLPDSSRPPSPKAAPLPFRPSVLTPPHSASTPESFSEDGEKEGEEKQEEKSSEMGCGYFFPAAGVPSAPSPPPGGFAEWDFFNPFHSVPAAEHTAAMAGELERSSDEDLRLLREMEGIPELEEAEEEAEKKEVVASEVDWKNDKGNGNTAVECAHGAEEMGIAVAETPGRGRDLLDALRAVVDHFIRAYDSGKEVSQLLETNRTHLQSGLDDLKESSKIIQAIAWHRSPSSLSSSYRSNCGASSNITQWTESKSDMFDGYGGMKSGSHSQALGRLYAWEKKLFVEVKAGDRTWQAYEKKCLQLRNQDAKGADSHVTDKIRTTVRDLYTRIWVALRAADSISDKIQKLRDEELQPQLVELVEGLMRTWKTMLESHETQKQIIFEVNSFTCPAYGKFSNDSQRLATLKLEAELRNWRACFMSYVTAQAAYVKALDGWLSKFILTDMVCYSRGKSSLPSHTASTPPLVVICHDWSIAMAKLPEKAVSGAMRSFIKSVRVLWVKQGEEQQQKRKADSLAKEIDKKVFAVKRAENRVLESKLLEHKPEQDAKQRMEYLSERKEMLNSFRKRLESEKAKHHDCMQDTHDVTLNGFKIGLAGIFESLTEFSKGTLNLYNELLTNIDRSKELDKITGKASCTDGSESQFAVVGR